MKKPFIDICGYKEGDEQSTTVRECGASKGQGFQIKKKSRSRKKKGGLENNKISPAKKI